MSPTLYLALAIVCEVVATTCLKLAAGNMRWLPVGGAVLGYLLAFTLFAEALKSLPVGVAYAIWAGLGTVGAAVVGWVLFSERLGLWQGLGIAAVLTGVSLLHAHPAPAAPVAVASAVAP